MKKKTVLFICSFNSVRSQMAEGFLKARCKDRYTVFSAGIAPAGLNPYAVRVMKEAGIDISTQKSKQLAQYRSTRFDFVVTLCNRAKKAVPKSLPKGETIIHHGFESPSDIQEDKEQILEDFRTLRDDIGAWLTVIFPDCPENRRDTGGPQT